MSTSAKQYDEALVNFYEEQLVAHADTAYRFAFALTLSLDGAAKCTKKAFQEISATLEQTYRAGDVNTKALLIAETWKSMQGIRGEKFAEGQSAVTKVLKPLSLEGRAALAAVDVAGLLPSDAAKALGWQEKDLRGHLAKARKALMATTL